MIQSVTFPLRTKSENEYRRMHWRTRSRETKTQRHVVGMVLRSQFAPQTVPCSVTMTRLSCGELDDDNLAGSLKSTRDAIAQWLGVDDRDKRVTWEKPQQEKCKRGTFFVMVRIENAQDGEDRNIEVGARR